MRNNSILAPKMFSKKVVSKPVFWTLTILFHSLCLSGLIWQLTQVSITYFQYKVVSDIEIIMPEKDKFKKYLNFCFQASETIRYDKYKKYLKKHGEGNDSRIDHWDFKRDFIYSSLSIEEQLETVMDTEIEMYLLNERKAFLWRAFICHQLNRENDVIFVLPRTQMNNVSYIWMSTSRYPDDYSWERDVQIKHEVNTTSIINLAINSYYVHRLASPFADECINFPELNLKNKYHAMYNCTEKDGNTTKLSQSRIVTEGDKHLMTFKRGLKHVMGDCGKYNRSECYSQTIFTQILSKNTYRPTDDNYYYFISFEQSNQPSTIVRSNAKIGFVDLITYIFGALGTWIGFSFLQLNPIPHLLTAVRDAIPDWKKADKQIIRQVKDNDDRIKTHDDNAVQFKAIFRLHRDHIINVKERLALIENRRREIYTRQSQVCTI